MRARVRVMFALTCDRVEQPAQAERIRLGRSCVCCLTIETRKHKLLRITGALRSGISVMSSDIYGRMWNATRLFSAYTRTHAHTHMMNASIRGISFVHATHGHAVGYRDACVEVFTCGQNGMKYAAHYMRIMCVHYMRFGWGDGRLADNTETEVVVYEWTCAHDCVGDHRSVVVAWSPDRVTKYVRMCQFIA